jgi:phospholipid/cholesterol/gamma-HCH transport system substrate-binding protein
MNEEPTPAPGSPASLEFRAALLVGALVLLVAASAAYLLYARGVFEPSQRLVLLSDDAEGVMVGMDLTFAGFPIGRVRGIELSDDGTTRIVIDVPRKDARWLRESSVFTLTRGLVGNTNLRAFSGVLSDPPLPAGAERRVLVGDATAEIPRLVAETRDLIRNLTQLTSSDSALAATLGHVQSATEKIAGPRGALGMLFGNEADAQKLVVTLDRTNALLARLDGLAARADQQVFGAEGLLPEARTAVVQLNAALLEARDSLKKIDAILVDAQAIAGNARAASTDLATLRSEVDANLRKVSRMIDEVNRRWPFARSPEIKLP